MKKMILKPLGVMAATFALTGAYADEPVKINANFDVALNTKYVWRGANLVNDFVVQPSVKLSSSGFSFCFWGNMETSNWNAPNYLKKPKWKFTEWDTSLDYTHQFDPTWSGTLGYVDYQFPGTGFKRFQEWYGAVGYTGQDVNAKLTVYRGVGKDRGTYATLNANKSFNAQWGNKAQAVNVGATLGWVDKKGGTNFYGANESGLSDLLLNASSTFELGKGWTMTPSLNYSTIMKNDFLKGAPRRTNFWAGFTFSRAFSF